MGGSIRERQVKTAFQETALERGSKKVTEAGATDESCDTKDGNRDHMRGKISRVFADQSQLKEGVSMPRQLVIEDATSRAGEHRRGADVEE